MSRFNEMSLVCVIGLVLAPPAARADDEKVPIDKLPAAVVEAVKAKFPDAQMVEAKKEKKGSETVFEVKTKHKGKKVDVKVTPEGKITEIERELAVADLPKAVADALTAKYPGAKLEEAEEDDEGGKVTYEVKVSPASGKKLKVTLDPKGKVIKEEPADADKSEKKEM